MQHAVLRVVPLEFINHYALDFLASPFTLLYEDKVCHLYVVDI